MDQRMLKILLRSLPVKRWAPILGFQKLVAGYIDSVEKSRLILNGIQFASRIRRRRIMEQWNDGMMKYWDHWCSVWVKNNTV
jgi:hypothetical protein